MTEFGRLTLPKMIPAKTLDELERNVSAIEHFQNLQSRLSAMRRVELAKPLPRNTCPGCFSSIYAGAAKQGWCCDCFPIRESYERCP